MRWSFASELSDDCWDRAPVPSDDEYDSDDYDRSLLEVVSANTNAVPTILEALETVDRLLGLAAGADIATALNRLLLANVITALETFLSDTFINRVLSDDRALRKFFKSASEISKALNTVQRYF